MNLAIEYLIRNKRARNYLTLPCSLFLITASGRKLVVTIHNAFGDNESIIVKHWKLTETKEKDKLPPFDEFKISKKDIFNSPLVVMNHCSLLEYKEQPYENGIRQSADYPQAFEQSQTYKSILEDFYNSKQHQERRMNWLWDAFESIYVNDKVRFHFSGYKLHRDLIEMYSKSIWFNWILWKKYLLDLPCSVASELVFRREYVPFEPIKSFIYEYL